MLAIAIMRDGIEDYYRYTSDCVTNSKLVERVKKGGQEAEEIESAEV